MTPEEKIMETRETLAAAIQKIDDLHAWLVDFRNENTRQHDANRAAVAENHRQHGMIYRTMWSFVAACLVAIIGVAGYLLESNGGPWVTKSEFHREIQHVVDAIDRITR